MFTGLFQFIVTKPNRAALAAGAIAALAMPPFGLVPLLLISLPILYYLLDAATLRQAFARGFLFMLAYHVLGLFWIASSMTVDLAKFWWAIPLAVIGLPAYFALYVGVLAAAYVRIKNKILPAGQPLLLALVLLAAQVAQGRFLTGFEWNLFGQTWDHVLPVLQSVSLFGIHGLTLLTLLLALTPVWWKQGQRRIITGIIMLFVVLGAWGGWRLTQHETAYQPNVQLRLVQPNIPQELKWDPELRDHNFETALRLAEIPAALKPSHIIWPEASVPYMISQDQHARLQIGMTTPGNGLSLVGSPWRDDTPNGRIYHNSMAAIDELGSITARFDKAHLVPFGEYFPLRALLKSMGLNINAIAAGALDFTPGPGVQTLNLLNLPPVSPLICYEVIFSGQVARDDIRPDWLLNLTNDAWFGTTTGPYQHFALARLRAIEEGIPLVRVANTGISGIVDAYGRVIIRTQLNQQVALDHGLPTPASTPTFFVQYRFIPLLGLIFICLLGVFAFCKRQNPTN